MTGTRFLPAPTDAAGELGQAHCSMIVREPDRGYYKLFAGVDKK
jgi:hypothetical protein